MEPSHAPGVDLQSDAGERATAGATVLVVDDDEDLRGLLVDILRDEGFEVRTAQDGGEAMEVIATLPQGAAMLLDLTMPRVDGREVLEWLRSRPDLHHVAVCIVSGEAELLPGATLAIRKPLLIHQWVRIVDWLRELPGTSGVTEHHPAK